MYRRLEISEGVFCDNNFQFIVPLFLQVTSALVAGGLYLPLNLEAEGDHFGNWRGSEGERGARPQPGTRSTNGENRELYKALELPTKAISLLRCFPHHTDISQPLSVPIIMHFLLDSFFLHSYIKCRNLESIPLWMQS